MKKVFIAMLGLGLIGCSSTLKTAEKIEKVEPLNQNITEANGEPKTTESIGLSSDPPFFYTLEVYDTAKVVKVDTAELSEFVNWQLTKDGAFKLDIIHPTGDFHSFILQDSQSLPASLKSKYPNWFSLKGSAINGDQIRMDFNANGLFIEVLELSTYNKWQIRLLQGDLYRVGYKL